MAIPKAKPSVTSWSTKCHQTKPGSSVTAALNASTAGSARPSFSPDSRFSEWRTMRGTRGLVTTLEDSTGSVGASNAPTRNASVQPKSVTTFVMQATSTHVIGIASTSFRSGGRHAFCSISPSTSRPSRNRIRIKATTARISTKSDCGSKSRTPSAASPSRKPAITKTAVSDRNVRCARPATSAPKISRTPKTAKTSSKLTAQRLSDACRASRIGYVTYMSEEQTQTSEQKDDAAAKAQEAEEKHERAKEKMEKLEENPPDKLENWPDDEAKYETFGGGEGVYDEKHEEALGEHSVRHHDDGKVEVKGEEVDNPDEYKGEPIPGGPTDPDSPAQPGEEKNTDED